MEYGVTTVAKALHHAIMSNNEFEATSKCNKYQFLTRNERSQVLSKVIPHKTFAQSP